MFKEHEYSNIMYICDMLHIPTVTQTHVNVLDDSSFCHLVYLYFDNSSTIHDKNSPGFVISQTDVG